MDTKTITARQQLRAAQSFAFFSILSVIIPVVIPIWIAASIFVYAAVAHHPNPQVSKYLVPAGYRFYGILGTWVVVLNFSPQLAKMAGGGLNLAFIIWAISFLVVAPLGIRDILRAKNEPWQDMIIKVEAA